MMVGTTEQAIAAADEIDAAYGKLKGKDGIEWGYYAPMPMRIAELIDRHFEPLLSDLSFYHQMFGLMGKPLKDLLADLKRYKDALQEIAEFEPSEGMMSEEDDTYGSVCESWMRNRAKTALAKEK
jgi:hypothetical protein